MDQNRELTQDECDALGLDAMRFQYEHGRPIRVGDLTDRQVVLLQKLNR